MAFVYKQKHVEDGIPAFRVNRLPAFRVQRVNVAVLTVGCCRFDHWLSPF